MPSLLTSVVRTLFSIRITYHGAREPAGARRPAGSAAERHATSVARNARFSVLPRTETECTRQDAAAGRSEPSKSPFRAGAVKYKDEKVKVEPGAWPAGAFAASESRAVCFTASAFGTQLQVLPEGHGPLPVSTP